MAGLLARLIRKETGGDLFRIQTKRKYPANYDKVIDQNHKKLLYPCIEEIVELY